MKKILSIIITITIIIVFIFGGYFVAKTANANLKNYL